MGYNDNAICALLHQQKYREVPKSIRRSNKLLINFVKPFKPISTSQCLYHVQPDQPQPYIVSERIYRSEKLTWLG